MCIAVHFKVQNRLGCIQRHGVSTHTNGRLLVFDASGLEVFLGLANPGAFGVSVNDAGDAVVVNMDAATAHSLNADDSFILCLVGKHWTLDNIADSVDAKKKGNN